MGQKLLLFFFFFYVTFSFHFVLFFSLASSSCNTTCGPIPISYPFGTGLGCGSPRFYPSVKCSSDNETGEDHLVLTTHSGTYPITSISYSASAITVSPPFMSNCSSMCPSTPNFGLDWSGPFQLGPSLFILLSCPPPTSSLTYKGSSTPICDSTKSHLCALIHTCPTIVSLGFPIYSPTTTCCVYSPANLGPRAELDIQRLRCAAYTSVISLGDEPLEPRTWEYGVILKYGAIGFNGEDAVPEVCAGCERSGGVCGYAPPKDYFICVCSNGVNTSGDCAGQVNAVEFYWTYSGGAALLVNWIYHFSIWVIVFLIL